MPKHTCCWVITPASKGADAVYCGKPTTFVMDRDDDGNRIRKYDSLCPLHRVVSDGLPKLEDEEDG